MEAPGWQASLRITAGGNRAALHLVPWQSEAASRLTFSPTALLPAAKKARLLGPGGLIRPLNVRPGGPVILDVPSSPWIVIEISA
jgi:hypothetical protein